MIDPAHEKRVRRSFLLAFGLCLCAVIPPLLSLVGSLRPQVEPPGQWFERSGAVMTVFAVFAQFKAGGIAAMIAGGSFAESWDTYHKYKRRHTAVAVLSLALVVFGTVVWGYGDLLFPRPDVTQRPSGAALLNMGWPPDFTVYKLLTDWGSLIGGVFALFAGAVAYFAGTMQATATRQPRPTRLDVGLAHTRGDLRPGAAPPGQSATA